MTIYEKALKDIYAAYDQLMKTGSQEALQKLCATIFSHQLLTGDPNGREPVGLIHGKSPIATAIDDVDVAQRAMKNWRNP